MDRIPPWELGGSKTVILPPSPGAPAPKLAKVHMTNNAERSDPTQLHWPRCKKQRAACMFCAVKLRQGE